MNISPLPDTATTPAQRSGPPSEQRPVEDHWRRFRRLMLLMTLVAIGTAAIAVWRMKVDGIPFHPHFVIAMGGGIIIALLLAGALMGLAFVSNRSGHDEDVSPPGA